MAADFGRRVATGEGKADGNAMASRRLFLLGRRCWRRGFFPRTHALAQLHAIVIILRGDSLVWAL